MKSKSKYPNKKIAAFGFTFDSKKEYERYIILKDMEKRGEIAELKVHPVFKLWAGDKPILGLGGKGGQRKYTADFSYIKDDRLVVEDVKPRKKAAKQKANARKYTTSDRPMIEPSASLAMSCAEAHYGFTISIIF